MFLMAAASQPRFGYIASLLSPVLRQASTFISDCDSNCLTKECLHPAEICLLRNETETPKGCDQSPWGEMLVD